VDYWNSRYSKETEYDWLGDYNSFKDLIHKHVKKDDKILMVGCGNSKLSQQMFEDGYRYILSTDISEVCIENQRLNFPHLEWQVADLRRMENLKNETFDVVIEKATLDALLVTEKSPWHPSDEAQNNIDQCLCEISRVLKSKKAKFLSLTFAQPHFRMPFYSKTKYKWNVDHEIFGSGFHYHCYSMTKGLALDDQVTIQSATDVSKVSLNINENYSSSSDEEDFVSRLDLSIETDDDESEDYSIPDGQMQKLVL